MVSHSAFLNSHRSGYPCTALFGCYVAGLERLSPKGTDAQESRSEKEEKNKQTNRKKEEERFLSCVKLSRDMKLQIMCDIERAQLVETLGTAGHHHPTDQVRGFILWKISKERARVRFRCTTRHCAMPKGKRKNRSTDVSNISNKGSVGKHYAQHQQKNKSQRPKAVNKILCRVL